MNYKVHYDRLIDRARNRVLVGYCEEHHIVPKCLGGGNEKENLIKLTAEEHFVAHQLLVKIYQGNKKLAYAAWAMNNGQNKNRSNKQYGWLRRKFAEAHRESMTGRIIGFEWRKNMSAARSGSKHPLFGKPVSEETRKKISDAGRGRIVSDETKKKMGEWQKGKPKSPESVEKMRLSQIGKHKGESNNFFGKKHSPETKEKMKKAWEKRRANS